MFARVFKLRLLCLGLLAAGLVHGVAPAGAQPAAPPRAGATPAQVGLLTEPEAAAQPLRSAGTIANVRVVGNQRIEEGTVRSYMLVQPGDVFDPERIDRSLKALYATGLFSDV